MSVCQTQDRQASGQCFMSVWLDACTLIGWCMHAGMEKHLGDYSFSGLSTRGEEGSLAEQAAQSAAASTFEVSTGRNNGGTC